MTQDLSAEEEVILAQVLGKVREAIRVLPEDEDLELTTDQLRPSMVPRFYTEIRGLGWTIVAMIKVADGIWFSFERLK